MRRDVRVSGLDLLPKSLANAFDLGTRAFATTMGPDQNLGEDGSGQNEICGGLVPALGLVLI